MIRKEYVSTLTILPDNDELFEVFVEQTTKALDLLPEVDVIVQPFDYTITVRSDQEFLTLVAEKQIKEISQMFDFDIVECSE